MNRRSFLGAMAIAALAVAVGGLSGARAASHRQAMAVSKARIRRLGQRLRASGWSDLKARNEIAAEARVYADHYRTLARIEGRV